MVQAELSIYSSRQGFAAFYANVPKASGNLELYFALGDKRWPLLQLQHPYRPIPDYMAFELPSPEAVEGMLGDLRATEERVLSTVVVS